jgi:carbamoyl-phosphate synthase small subunit
VIETHVSLFDGSNCGIAIAGKKAFGVQYHPGLARPTGQLLSV